MTRKEFIKQRCEIEKITEEEFEETYRVVKCNCGMPYCKGYRCLDLDDLLKENQRLKDNWNTLKEHCNTMLSIFEKMGKQNREKQLGKYVIYDRFLSKMQELEQMSGSK